MRPGSEDQDRLDFTDRASVIRRFGGRAPTHGKAYVRLQGKLTCRISQYLSVKANPVFYQVINAPEPIEPRRELIRVFAALREAIVHRWPVRLRSGVTPGLTDSSEARPNFDQSPVWFFEMMV